MAWYRCGGGGGSSIPIISVHSGKINLPNGTIEADSDFYYTDMFDAPNGQLMFDLGDYAYDVYIGLEMCASDGSHVDWWEGNSRYRVVSHDYYYARAPKLRMSFRKANLSKVVVHDKVNNIVYTGADLVKVE